eukprot:8390964-Pyramimonas_sp.AAC.2
MTGPSQKSAHYGPVRSARCATPRFLRKDVLVDPTEPLFCWQALNPALQELAARQTYDQEGVHASRRLLM